MGFEDDPAVKAVVKKMEREEKAEREAAESSLRQEERAHLRRTIRREVKNKILLYTALVFTLVLVWQKINIVIFIPGTFLHLLLIFGGIFLLLYVALNTMFKSDDG